MEISMKKCTWFFHKATNPIPHFQIQSVSFKSLYGLKQANRQWFSKLTSFLLNHGFIQSYADTSLFTYNKGSDFLALVIYVDDILLAGKNLSLINHFKQQLDITFSIKDLGHLNYYLGIEFLRN